jgi:hypothetical protein
MDEEVRVHVKTHEILRKVNIKTMTPVLQFYEKWCQVPEELKNS